MRKLLLIFCFFPLVAVGGQVTVEGVRVWAAPDHTRVVFDLSAPLEHNLFTLKAPDRIVLDLGDARFGKSGIPEPTGLLAGIRHAPRNESDLRVVLDIKARVRPKSFLVAPNKTYGHRLVVDLEPLEVLPFAPVKEVPTESGRDVVIAVDAGHGGEDPGAIGRGGTREKGVVLNISKRLVAKINAEPGMRGVLVRKGDYFIPRRKRMDIARKHRADMFVSIHADAFKDARPHGASVYALSRTGASSEMARWLAEQDNASDLVGGVKLSDKDDLVRSVLLDLSQTATLGASLSVGKAVLKEMGHVNHLHKDTVQQANFAVLKSPDIPSILVEAGFISNPQEERRLKDPAYQERIARSVLNGIRSYFYDSPPQGTRIALYSNPRNGNNVRHTIARGDTLSGLARRYQTSQHAIRVANKIRGDRIRVGDTLLIPSGT